MSNVVDRFFNGYSQVPLVSDRMTLAQIPRHQGAKENMSFDDGSHQIKKQENEKGNKAKGRKRTNERGTRPDTRHKMRLVRG